MKRATDPHCRVTLTAAEAVEFLTPDLVDFLADLHGSPLSLAQAAIQLLPFGSRSALVTTGLVTADDGGDGAGTDVALLLTPLGVEVIAWAGTADDNRQIDQLAARAAAIAARQQR
jgi:hypothetical protein